MLYIIMLNAVKLNAIMPSFMTLIDSIVISLS
jgi:hypothetical protein